MITLGEVAYNAYCRERNWKSFKGDPLPAFQSQTDDLKAAWEKSAEAVASFCREQTSMG